MNAQGKMTPKDWEKLAEMLAKASAERPKDWIFLDANLAARQNSVELEIENNKKKQKNRKMRGL